MRSLPWKETALLVFSTLLTLLVVEGALRLLIEPSTGSFGTLFGHEVPPLKIILDQPFPEEDRSAPFGDRRVEGRPVTIGDIYGIFRTDVQTGYVPQESAISHNGWWQTNSMGARARLEVGRQVPAGFKRVLIFGESFAQGSGLPQEDTWPAILDRLRPQVEVLNFAVDGYSMGQAYLRYQQIQSQLDFDLVLVVFVPAADLWRDINVLRHLGEEGWRVNFVLPRFVIEEDRLKLIRSPYASPLEYWQANHTGVTPDLEHHLLAYERFYFPARYREPSFLGKSVLWRLYLKVRFDRLRGSLWRSLIAAESEAVQVSRALFTEMRARVSACGKEMVLVILPLHRDLQRLEEDRAFEQDWKMMVAAVCPQGLRCIDLSAEMQQWPPDTFDKSFEGDHFGPRASRGLAVALADHLFPNADPDANAVDQTSAGAISR